MPRARGALVWPLSATLALLASLHTGVASSRTGIPGGFPQDKGTENAKTPPLYDTIRDAKLVHAGIPFGVKTYNQMMVDPAPKRVNAGLKG